MSAPGYPFVAPPVPAPERPKPRRWLIAIVVAWALVLAGLAVWSIRNDPPTVPEQLDLARALPILQRATGAMLAAADGPDRAVVLGELRLARGCRITPVRDGIEATRDVSVYVQADQAAAALDAIALALPAGYHAQVAHSSRATRVVLHADAGGYVAVDADTPADAQVFSLEASTGCRPVNDAAPEAPGPAAGPAPGELTDAVTALGGHAPSTPAVQTIGCPGGGSAGTYTVDDLAAPADLGSALQRVVSGATVVRSDPRDWAYRHGADSVVVTEDGGRVRVSVTTACR